VARYISFLKDFHYQLKHVLGSHNHTNALSRWPDYDDRKGDNDNMVILLNISFIQMLLTMRLDELVWQKQNANTLQLMAWKEKYQLRQKKDGS